MVCFGVFFGWAMIEVGVHLTKSPKLEDFGSIFPNIVETFLLLPILFSVLTHVNLDNRIGLWLGLLIGVPPIFTTTVEMLPLSGLLLSVISIVLLIVALIFLWENKTLILETLALDEPNQDMEDEPDEPDEDVMDHLIATPDP